MSKLPVLDSAPATGRPGPVKAPPPAAGPTQHPGVLRVTMLFTGVAVGLASFYHFRVSQADLDCLLLALALWSFTVTANLTLGTVGLSARVRAFHQIVGERLLILTATLVCGWQLWTAWQSPALSVPSPADRVLALSLLGLGVLAWFLGSYAQAERRLHEDERLAALPPLLRFLATACLALSLAVLVRLATAVDPVGWVGLGAGTVVTALLLEGSLGVLISFYQPRSLRLKAAPIGQSALLGWIFERENGWLKSIRAFETAFGLKVGDTVVFGFLRRAWEPALVSGALLLWASTLLTSVPTGHQGVLLAWGRFQATPLAPGLHVHLPWPAARVEIVNTSGVREATLGFDQDLEGPILWAEQHYAGEKSILVSGGNELLTISVPIHYRVKDAVAYLRHTGELEAAVTNLGYRALVGATSTYSSFGLMTVDRAEVSELLRTRLQEATDRLGLGVEIIWIGLKDIHPPVAVAPAFQEVVSAEEEKLAIVDRERAESIVALQEAASTAVRLRSEAEATAHARTSGATGEAIRFNLLREAASSHAELFRIRRRQEATQAGLENARRILVLPGGSTRAEFFIDAPAAALNPQLVR